MVLGNISGGKMIKGHSQRESGIKKSIQNGDTKDSAGSMKVERVYLGGGGEGAACLVTSILKTEQDAMFQR